MDRNRQQANPRPKTPAVPCFYLLMVAAQSLSIDLARQILNHRRSPTANLSPEDRAEETGQQASQLPPQHPWR
ncbi:hypothetical protein [Microbulbifer sp. 2205BS26-8]|uniref:hypothetical protein n=1 Tax=Microbulbifer sp. 2205BS26-8 TaxID=3064386 RepID=UPI00273E4DB9|nr:hypothetical protein [Microbulbifer sp. 2205BS26-8]MDP5209580.1 hypothetical protein [Microbulbifer sp. 2205BS26-8]